MLNSSVDPATGAAVQLCGNCRRWIPAGNYNTHSMGCARNCLRCGVCQALVKRCAVRVCGVCADRRNGGVEGI